MNFDQYDVQTSSNKVEIDITGDPMTYSVGKISTLIEIKVSMFKVYKKKIPDEVEMSEKILEIFGELGNSLKEYYMNPNDIILDNMRKKYIELNEKLNIFQGYSTICTLGK